MPKLRTTPKIARWLPPLAAGLAALALGKAFPLVSALLFALVLGAFVGNTALHRHGLLVGHEGVTKLLLRLGVVLLGLRLPLQSIVDLGPRSIIVIVSTVAVTFTVTCLIGDRLGVERGLVTLIAAGFSVCGASAIAAVEGGIRRRTEDVALAIGLVTIFGSAMIIALPLASNVMGLSATRQGVWAGASIHEVAQVVAATTTAGVAAVAIATTIKLGRVALLAFVYMIARRRDGNAPVEGIKAPLIPWFVLGFLIAATIRTVDVLPAPALDVADFLTTLLLASAMFGLGLGMRIKVLFPVPLRVFGLAACSTLVAATVSLGLTLALF